MAGADPRKGLRVLSLDGPPFAAAALSEPLFLQQIAHRWAFNEDDEDDTQPDDVRVSDMFDIISGCGTGGLYAILFTRLNMTIGQVITFHNTLQEKLFKADCWAQKDHQECTKAFDLTLDQMIPDTVDLNSPLFSKDCKKCYIVVLNEAKANTPLPRALRSYKVRAGSSPRCTIRQALHATLADLQHFPAVPIGDEEFVCASDTFPNTSHLLMKELAAAFPELELACFVNLGADHTRPTNDSRRVGEDLMSQFRDLDCFFRLSLKEELHPDSRITSFVMGCLQEDETSTIVDKIVDAVKSRKQVVKILRLGNLAGQDGKNALLRDVMYLRNEEEMKRGLKRIRAPYDFRPIHEHGCLPGTREDVLKHIESWADEIDAPNVFWLEGYPGTGKTAISMTLKQRLAAARRLGAACFFRREDASQHNLSTLFGSLASQLASNHSFIRGSIFHAVNSGVVVLESDPSTLFEKLVCDPLVSASVGCSEPIVLVLDAMDEYGRSDEDRIRLIKLLLPRWTQLPPKYKLFITSRSQGDLPRHLDLPGHTARRLEVGNTTSIETKSDIRRFLEYNFEEIQTSRGSGNSSPFITPSELDELVAASAGLFIWASTVIAMVKPMRNHVRQILLDLRESGTTIGKTRMDALHHLYSTILQPLVDDNGVVVSSFLSAVIYARTPLSATTLSPLCKLDVDVIEDTAIQLGPVMDTADGLRFVHKSFVDYVLSQYFPARLNVDNAEFMLASSCFRIMHDQLHFNMGNMPSSYMLNSDVPNLREALSEELQYASRFWGTHVTHLQKEGRDELSTMTKKIENFLNHQFLYWVEAVSILGCFREGIDALSNLGAAKLGKTVAHVAIDALAFLRQFALPIAQSYPHIYFSAVPWAPRTSFIRMRYVDTVRNVLKVKSGGDESWPAQLAAIGHDEWAVSVAFSPDGFQIISGSVDSTIRVWDATTRQGIGEPLLGHDGSISSVAFSPDGSQIVSGSVDKTIRIWDATTRHHIGEPLRDHSGSVFSAVFSPDGSQIISGSFDNTVRIWDAVTRLPIGEPLRGHTSSVQSVAVSPDGYLIVSGSRDKTLRIWNATTGQPIEEPLHGHDDWVLSVAFSPDGSQIVSGSRDKTIRIWDATTRQSVGKHLQGHSDWVISVVFSPDGSRIISGSKDNTIQIWDAATRQPVGEPFRGHEGCVLSVTCSPSGSQIASGSKDNTVRIWDLAARQSVEEISQGHDGWHLSIRYPTGGSQVTRGFRDTTIQIWDATDCQRIGDALHGNNSSMSAVAFSPNSPRMVSGSDDHTVQIWDTLTLEAVGEPLQCHDDCVVSVAFSPDGSQFVSGSNDRTVQIWNATTHMPIGEPLRGHRGPVLSVAFSPDGSQIVSGSRDKTVRIWDVATCQPAGDPLRGHSGLVFSVAFSLDGSQIVSGSTDKTIRIWSAATHQPVGDLIHILNIVSFPRDSHPFPFPLLCFLLHDGWLINQHNCRLMWIPQHLHEFLPTPGLVEPHNQNMLVVDIAEMRTGTGWCSCVDTN